MGALETLIKICYLTLNSEKCLNIKMTMFYLSYLLVMLNLTQELLKVLGGLWPGKQKLRKDIKQRQMKLQRNRRELVLVYSITNKWTHYV